jgi:hypothetical protein
MKWKYLKHAFWLRSSLPLVGELPLNAMAVAGCGILGFVQPGFWWLALGMETAYLWSVAGNDRFHNVVDALEVPPPVPGTELPLFPENVLRVQALERQHRAITQSYATYAATDFTARENLRHLEHLMSIYAGLLRSQQHLAATSAAATQQDLQQKVNQLQQQLTDPKLSPKTKSSKEDTQRTMQQRLRILQDRETSLREIDSDLERIETQFQLAEESATLHAKPTLLSLDLDFASKMLAEQ